MVEEFQSTLELNRVVIWGGSLSGEDCLKRCQEAGIEVLFFVDRSAQPGDQLAGIPVYSTDYLFLSDSAQYDAVVLAMGADPSGPKAQLKDAGISKPVFPYRQGGEMAKTLQRSLCANFAIRYEDSEDDKVSLDAVADHIVNLGSPLAIYGAGHFTDYLLSAHPYLAEHVCALVDDDSAKLGARVHNLIVASSVVDASTVLLGTTSLLNETRMEARLRSRGFHGRVLRITDILAQMLSVPEQAWGQPDNSIYPVDIPWIEFEENLDFVLLDLPPRFYGTMPNGLGYVHNILEGMDIRVQTMDLDLIFYHRYHMSRILDGRETVVSPTGYVMKHDPWSVNVIMDEWSKPDVLEFFEPEIRELVSAIERAKPKIVGLSLHGTNLEISREVVRRVRQVYPEVVIVVGGYDCIRPAFGANVFADFDYMVIFEAENSLDKLVFDILAGKKPKNVPGVISKYDISALPFVAAPTVDHLDDIPFPKYPWVDVSLYRNYNGSQQTPIVLSRGCRWSRCTFCGERFSWRRRSPENVVDEIQWMVERGRNTFVFNDSDLSGDPAAVRAMCEEILKRGMTDITLSGQLRVQKGYSQEYFDVISKAGFKSLNYGIDGWAKNTLKLHKKGYTLSMIEDVIKYTYNAGIKVEINLVVGIPGETESDIDETIDNMIKNKEYIEGIANLNTLILGAGSLYWEEPEKYGICFKADRDEVFRQSVKMIPTELWYSVDPYIDQQVRLERVRRIVEAANQAGLRISSHTDWKMQKLEAESVDV